MRAGSLLSLCSEQLDSSPVTELKFCKPFYLLNAAFQTLLPDHSPSFSHNVIATSCIQATLYSSSNTLSPAVSLLKSHKYCFGLYETFTTQPLHAISPQFNTFNPLISDPFHHFFTVCWHILRLTYACSLSDSLAFPIKESGIRTLCSL